MDKRWLSCCSEKKTPPANSSLHDVEKQNAFMEHSLENETILNNTLEENVHDIVDSFSGLSNIVQLCLTNPNASKQIDKDKFVAFETIMREHIIV